MSGNVVIAGATRTPIGSFCGALESIAAPALGSRVVKATVERSGIAADAVDEVIFGNVLGAGLGQNVARQVTIGAGLDPGVHAMTINKVCGSGLMSVMLAAQAIELGEAGVVVAGGAENMPQAPYLLPKGRTGYRMGHGEVIDSMIRDGLWDVYNDMHMGMCGDRCAEKYELTREDQDNFAVASYERALAAAEEGRFEAEIVPVEVPGRKGAVTVVDRDEEPQRFNEEKLRALRPAFGKEGTVTAGNASSINDGAASVVVVGDGQAGRLADGPRVRLLAQSTFSREPEWFTLAPIGAIQALLDKLSLTVEQVDLFEINEAFSAVTLAAMKELDIPHEKVNVNGGAAAIGHPIGASGARTLVTLIHAMHQRDAKVGIDVLCIGGGEAVAVAVERC